MTKAKLVIFEGPDKTGKDTLYQKYRRATLWGPLCIVRFIGSNEVYDKLYGRGSVIGDYRHQERELMEQFDVYLVSLTGNARTLADRIIAFDPPEQKREALINIKEVIVLFEQSFHDSEFVNKIILDTTERDINLCLQDILSFTQEGPYAKE